MSAETALQETTSARERLLAYLDRPRTYGFADTRKSASPLVAVARRVVPGSFVFRSRLLVTDLLVVRERRRARQLAQRRPLLLHPGSQKVRKEGWVNIDVAGFPVDLTWNLMRPLPFTDASVDAVYHEHLLEHFSLRDGLTLTEEFFRVLRPGGVLRMGVPNTRVYIESYVSDPSGFLDEVKPNRPTPLLAVQELFYWPQHRTMYDHETLELLFRAAGFADVEQRGFGDSSLDPCPDSEHRRLETLYVEAVKPLLG